MAAGSDTGLLLRLQLRCLLALTLSAAASAAAAYWAAGVLLRPWVPLLLVAAEAAFFFAWRQKHQQLGAIPERHEPEGHDGWQYFEKFHASSHSNVRFLAMAELIKCWFDGVPTMEIRRGNAAELVARGYFYKTLDQLKAEGKDHLVETMLCALEEVWGVRFEEGLNQELQYLDHLQEPLKVSYRPLTFYAFSECAAAMKHIMLLAAGFKGHTYGAYTYYTYNLPTLLEAARGARASRDHLHPIVFLHGVGLGLLPYIPFLLRLAALGRPVLAVEYKHLSMRWTDFIPTAPQVAKDMSAMLALHGIHKASMIAHSYGTFYVSCLLKLVPEKVHCMALLDPVCCCMWSGHLISNFVYNPARSTTGLITWLIARDIHTAASVSRNFFWTDVNMWPDEIPDASLFVLSEQDDLVPVRHVHHMVRHETSAQVIINPKMHHADFLFSPQTQDNILAAFAEMVQVPSGAVSRSNTGISLNSESELTPEWSFASGMDAVHSSSGGRDSSSTKPLRLGARLKQRHGRSRSGSSSAGSDDGTYTVDDQAL